MKKERNLPIVTCACGCGRKFRQRRKDHRYFSASCKFKGWRNQRILIDPKSIVITTDEFKLTTNVASLNALIQKKLKAASPSTERHKLCHRHEETT